MTYIEHIRSIESTRRLRSCGHAGSGGLQRHSIGNTYPYMVVVYGDGRCAARHSISGEEHMCETLEAAIDKCDELRG